MFCDSGIELKMQRITRTMLDKGVLLVILMQTIGKSQLPFFFEFLDYTWGHIQWTVFVIFYNKKVNKLYSGLWKPGCSGVDFFVQNLTRENCLVVPQVKFIHRTIHYSYTSKAVATLVVSFWPSSHVWPIIGRNVLDFVVDYKIV